MSKGNPIDLSGRKILITGASSGIGRATAVLTSQLGASVVMCGRDDKRLSETEAMLCGGGHCRINFDITEFDRYGELFDNAVSDGIKLDGLVHCAGIAKVLPLRIMSVDAILDVMNVNFVSFMQLTSFYTKKRYSNGGSIVAVSAANAHYPQKCMSVYAASKGALEAAVRTLALELARQGTRINCVVPGPVDTPMLQNLNEDFKKRIKEYQLLGIASPEDIANMIAFLLSGASAKITGRSMFVDAGCLGGGYNGSSETGGQS